MTDTEFNSRLYQKLPQIVLGFHGCDQTAVERVLTSSEEHLRPSRNEYDWLGNGIYFWLNDPQRAYEWACESSKRNPHVKNPAVIGAIIDLGTCLNLCERESILLLQKSYRNLEDNITGFGLRVDEVYKNSKPDEGGYAILRDLDCAVIENLHRMMEESKEEFDTVYGYFQEGEEAFPGAGIMGKSHIQICVRNISCIKGYFLPRLK